jgi:hypothetical protein
MIAFLRQSEHEQNPSANEPRLIGELLPELMARRGISLESDATRPQPKTTQGNFGSRFSRKAAKPSEAA